MIRILLTFAILFFAQFANATGKISLQTMAVDQGREYRSMAAFSVYEKLMDRVGLNLWAGYGHQFVEDGIDKNWAIGKGQVDVYFGDFTISPGVQYKTLPNSEDNYEEVSGYLRLDYKLW